jgi:hypothetical protein
MRLHPQTLPGTAVLSGAASLASASRDGLLLHTISAAAVAVFVPPQCVAGVTTFTEASTSAKECKCGCGACVCSRSPCLSIHVQWTLPLPWLQLNCVALRLSHVHQHLHVLAKELLEPRT